jgi:hypothetical protein
LPGVEVELTIHGIERKKILSSFLH